MPHLHSTTLFRGDGLLLRRVTCDGADERRPAEERSDVARVILVLRGRFAYRDRVVRAVASPCASLYLHDGAAFQIRHVDGEGDACLVVQGRLCDALTEAGPTMRELSEPAYRAVQSMAARLAGGEAFTRLSLETSLCEALSPPVRAPRVAPKDRDVAATIAHTVERDFHALLSLGELAGQAGVSVFEACRAFKRAMGTSIHQYHQEVRLRHALALLLETDLPLAHLALDVGFASQSHFTNRFRRRFRTTPRAVRRTGRPPR